MINLKKIIYTLICSITLSSCATLNITNESLMDQINQKSEQNKEKKLNKYSSFKYESNNIDVLECTKKTGEKVKLEINKNTSLKIYVKNYKYEVVEVAFDTVTIEDDKLIGYESRITAVKHTIPISSIMRLQVLTIFPSYE